MTEDASLAARATMNVAVGVITDVQQHVLITRRPLHVSCGGVWEFPGGKLEKEELPSKALLREIQEEVGLHCIAFDKLGEIRHSYQHQEIVLFVYHVHHYQGEAVCREGQLDLRWVALESLEKYQFPAANIEIIQLIKQKLLGKK